MKKTNFMKASFILAVSLLCVTLVMARSDEKKQNKTSSEKELKAKMEANGSVNTAKPVNGVRPCLKTQPTGVSEIKRSKYETLPAKTKEAINAHPEKYKVVN